MSEAARKYLQVKADAETAHCRKRMRQCEQAMVALLTVGGFVVFGLVALEVASNGH